MTSVPYPTFETSETSYYHNISAVGRCRIGIEKSEVYSSVLAKCKEHASLTPLLSDTEKKDETKKAQKKLYKQSVGALMTYVSLNDDEDEGGDKKDEKLDLDPSITNIEFTLPGEDVIETDGLLASVLLDAGASAVVMDGHELEAMDKARIPRSRMVAHFNKSAVGEDEIKNALMFANKISIRLSADDIPDVVSLVTKLKDIVKEKSTDMCEKSPELVVLLSPSIYYDSMGNNDAENKAESLAECVAKLSKLGTEHDHVKVSLIDPTATELGLSFSGCFKTDREDGLYTTVVCARNGEALGLVYSAKISIIASLKGRRAVYFSRSRGGLWRKGDTSGKFQVLHRIDVDCDGDAVRFTVTQKGDVPAFCHLDTYTCWGEPCGVRHLEFVLNDRLREAPEGSYTKRLFDDETLLRDKLVEEAQELSEADTKQHVAEELADVLYFAMVRAVKAGINLDDAVSVLDQRARKVTRRKGDSKQFRIDAGNAILKK